MRKSFKAQVFSLFGKKKKQKTKNPPKNKTTLLFLHLFGMRKGEV